MNQEFDDATMDALVAYRRRRAHETLKEADLLGANGCYNAAINRLYYATFYIITGLLAKNHIPAKTHDGVQKMFNLHFVLTGKIDKKFSRIYRRLFNDRLSGDYDDFLLYDEEMFNAVRPQVEEFIYAVEVLIG